MLVSPAKIEQFVARLEQLIALARANAIDAAVSTMEESLRVFRGDLAAKAGEHFETWDNLPASDQDALLAKAQALLREFEGHVASIRCDDAGALMSSKCASTGTIVVLLLFAIAGLGTDLWFIHDKWSDAVGTDGTNAVAAVEEATEKAKLATAKAVAAEDQARAAAQALAAANAEAPPKPATITHADSLYQRAETASEQAKGASSAAWDAVAKVRREHFPPGRDILLMVILLGGLGGFIHLATSLTMFVGNRQFVRSWIVYYLLAPLQGAALAPIMYLLLSSTVLGLPATAGGDAKDLNLVGIYGFSALTGMFAKQAIEKLREVFATVFTKVKGADASK